MTIRVTESEGGGGGIISGTAEHVADRIGTSKVQMARCALGEPVEEQQQKVDSGKPQCRGAKQAKLVPRVCVCDFE